MATSLLLSSLLLSTLISYSSNAVGSEVKVLHLNSVTECRNSFDDDIKMTITCTLNGSNKHPYFEVNGLLITSFVMNMTSTCFSGEVQNCPTNTTTVAQITLSANDIDLPSCLYNVTCTKPLGGDIISRTEIFILKDCEILPTPVCNHTIEPPTITSTSFTTITENTTVTSTSVVTKTETYNTTLIETLSTCDYDVGNMTTTIITTTTTTAVSSNCTATDVMMIDKTVTMGCTSTIANYTSTVLYYTTVVITNSSETPSTATITLSVVEASVSFTTMGIIVTVLVTIILVIGLIVCHRTRRKQTRSNDANDYVTTFAFSNPQFNKDGTIRSTIGNIKPEEGGNNIDGNDTANVDVEDSGNTLAANNGAINTSDNDAGSLPLHAIQTRGSSSSESI